MHGIRDNGGWSIEVDRALQTVANSLNRSVEPIKAGYGYFPMFRFLFLSSRQTNVRWFMDRYTEVIARYPEANVSFVGHSNGTYLLAAALQRYESFKIHRAAFAGSVVPKAYPWDQLVQQQRVTAIRNDMASADWVVGVFPGFFELLHLSDIGTAGHNGFQDDAPKDSSFNKYFKGGHGAALNSDNYRSVAEFILTGQSREPQGTRLVAKKNGVVAFIAKQCLFVVLAIVLAIAGIGYFVCQLLSRWIPLPLSMVVYGLLVLLLLYTL